MAAFTVIDHTELGAAASSYDVTSISASYDHLYLVISTRGDVSAYFMNMNLTLNGDTGTNYSGTEMYADQTTVSSWRHSGSTSTNMGLDTCGASMLADTFGSHKIWIPHYSNTANFKQILAFGAAENNTTTANQWREMIGANLWSATAAVNQITLTPASGDFVQYSTFTLYGVTGA
jgi:hypothetical protein